MSKTILALSVLLAGTAAQAKWTLNCLAALPSMEGNFYHEGWTLTVGNRSVLLKNRTQGWQTKYVAESVQRDSITYIAKFADGTANVLDLPRYDFDSTSIPLGLKMDVSVDFASGDSAKAKCVTVPTL